MSIKTKNILELKDHSFYVPSYQRGYRWTEPEVIALFKDINDFSTNNDKQRYCIQPLIVKKRDDGMYEVVDGQQRLTTIYIFMKIASEEIKSATPPFNLEYETRKDSKDSKDFLENLSDNKKNDKDSNIDYSHIYSAYENINKWLEEQNDRSVAIQKLNTKIRESVFFIWYELPRDTDPISVFTKVNLGKIPLTNAELIKALILNKENFKDLEDRKKIQTEISISWDRIEQDLNDDSFWYFLNKNENSKTRIDFIFDFIANKYNVENKYDIDSKQNYFSFLVISEFLNSHKDNKEKGVKDFWSDVEKQYLEFKEWYLDLDKYHIIGYLINTGTSFSTIFDCTRNKRKSEIIYSLIKKTQNEDFKDLDNLYFENRTKPKIRKLLLLFNISTLVCKAEKQYRFPFDIYIKEKWDIEHIHANSDGSDEPDNSIANLTLLDASTNRSYKGKPFNEKRSILLERESNGLFVPLCTKNIFLKAYTESISDFEKWSKEDKDCYLKKMNNTLKEFWEKAERKENKNGK